MNQSGGVERLSRPFRGESLCGQLTKLGVDQGQQLAGSLRIALLGGRQDSAGVAHQNGS
jgi:hypothetical protein